MNQQVGSHYSSLCVSIIQPPRVTDVWNNRISTSIRCHNHTVTLLTGTGLSEVEGAAAFGLHTEDGTLCAGDGRHMGVEREWTEEIRWGGSNVHGPHTWD